MAESVEVELLVDASGAIRGVKSAGKEFVELGSDAAQAGDRASRGMEDAEQSTRKLAQAQDRMSRSGSKSNQILFSAGDAVQDVQFGFAGAANNIAFMGEQFAELVSDAGGARTALSSIAGSLLGVGGVILAFQALLALAPQIIAFFRDTGDAAEESARQISEAEETYRQLIQTLASEVVAEDEERGIGALRAQLQEARTELERLGQQRVALSRLAKAFERSAEAAERVRGLEKALASTREVALNQVVRIEENLENARKIEEERWDLLVQQSKEIEEQFGIRVESQREAQQRADQLGREQQLYQAIVEETEKALFLEERRAELGLGEQEPEPEEIEAPPVEPLPPMDADVLEGLDEQRMRELINGLDLVRKNFGEAEKKALDFGAVMSGALAEGIGQAVTMIAEGEPVFEAVGRLFGTLFQRLGSAMIAYGISLEALKTPNPFVAIAGGIGLIAAGTLINKLLGEASEQAGGSGRAGGTGQRRLEGGGEGGIEFGPRGDGARRNLAAAAGAAGPRAPAQQVVVVESRTRVDGNISVDDPFRLASEINEANRVLDRTNRQ